MHGRLGSATLSQLAFPGESNLNFPCQKSQQDNTVVKGKTKTNKCKKREREGKKEDRTKSALFGRGPRGGGRKKKTGRRQKSRETGERAEETN